MARINMSSEAGTNVASTAASKVTKPKKPRLTREEKAHLEQLKRHLFFFDSAGSRSDISGGFGAFSMNKIKSLEIPGTNGKFKSAQHYFQWRKAGILAENQLFKYLFYVSLECIHSDTLLSCVMSTC